jgi:galactose mutarotase-like enzyme
MLDVQRRDGAIPTLILSDAEGTGGGSRAVLAPARGGMLIGLEIGGRELLYLDRTTFEEPIANVRGGVPVLFPSPGKLTSDAWTRAGLHGTLRQHGFARNLPWEVTATGTDHGAWATLTLASNDVTMAAYPWAFRADYTYRLRGRSLAIEMCFRNTSAAGPPMPFGAGFHPYFAVKDADKPAARITTAATRAFDNAAKREIPFTGFDLAAAEVDLHLLDHGSTESTLTSGDVAARLVGSPELTHWVVWTLRHRDFVCLEPWTCPGDALNTGERLILLAPGEARSLRLSIERL